MIGTKYEVRKKCVICGTIFLAKTIESIYCCKKCSEVAYKRKKDEAERNAKLDEIAKQVPDIREQITVNEAVAIYAVERDALYRMIRLGRIPFVNMGKRMIRLKRSDMDELYPLRKVAREQKEAPLPKMYRLEPEDCYTIGEVSQKYRINDSTVYTHIRKYSIPTRQIGRFVYVPKSEIDKLYNPEGL